MILIFFVVVGFFLLGQLSAGKLIARARGVDLRQLGSGSVGATNVSRIFGLKIGLVTLLADVLKGFVPYFFQGLASGADWFLPIAGLAVVLGHCYAGGKGVATTLGVLLAFSYQVALVALASFIIVFTVTGIVSASSIVAAIVIPVAAAVFGLGSPYLISLIAISVLVIYRHRQNIERLFQGEEKRFFAKKL